MLYHIIVDCAVPSHVAVGSAVPCATAVHSTSPLDIGRGQCGAYSGMLPCFFVGFFSSLPASMARSSQMRCLVVAGSIMSSTNPRTAAENGLANFSAYSASRALMARCASAIAWRREHAWVGEEEGVGEQWVKFRTAPVDQRRRHVSGCHSYRHDETLAVVYK